MLLQDLMENKAMYLHTVSDRDTSSVFEEPFDGRSLSKLNLCEDGECFKPHLSTRSAGPLQWDAGDLAVRNCLC